MGDWSRYSYRGPESTSDYHELLREFLQSMCTRRLGELYCDLRRRATAATRSTRPSSTYTGPDADHGEAAHVAPLQVSKLSAVEVEGLPRQTSSCSTRLATFRRGAGAFAWRPRAPGCSPCAWAPRSCAPAWARRTAAPREIEVEPEP